MTVYGEAEHRGETHTRREEHDYQPWRPAPGSVVSGWFCTGCGDLQVD